MRGPTAKTFSRSLEAEERNMEFIVMCVLLGVGFYLIRNPERINWRRLFRRESP